MDHEREIAFLSPANLKRLPECGLIAAGGLSQLRKAAPDMKDALILFGLSKVSVGDGLFLAAPVLGAPLAVMVMEELVRRGAREIIFFGLAGSLGQGLKPGDLICPSEGISTEGTSAHYPAPLKSCPSLRARLMESGKGLGVGDGLVWSTDGIYRETLGLIEKQKKRGAGVVDMESTALMAAAAFRKISLVPLLVVSDVLDGCDHHLGFKSPDFKKGLAKAAEIAWRVFKA